MQRDQQLHTYAISVTVTVTLTLGSLVIRDAAPDQTRRMPKTMVNPDRWWPILTTAPPYHIVSGWNNNDEKGKNSNAYLSKGKF